MFEIMEEISHGGSEDKQIIESIKTLASPSKITNLKPRFIAVDIARKAALASPQTGD